MISQRMKFKNPNLRSLRLKRMTYLSMLRKKKGKFRDKGKNVVNEGEQEDGDVGYMDLLKHAKKSKGEARDMGKNVVNEEVEEEGDVEYPDLDDSDFDLEDGFGEDYSIDLNPRRDAPAMTVILQSGDQVEERPAPQRTSQGEDA
ncbi:uncharacterized protein G2W53_032740 [Senna tora]|uniref:Uncharacterized protein n=1 Tax=Senna tora TaxID=362788 RepID=A0A834SX96_9FABA|nr:uncharacterized protein G2W53_032740 [Senna tora]